MPFARLITTLPFAEATVKVAAPLSWAQPVKAGRLPLKTSTTANSSFMRVRKDRRS